MQIFENTTRDFGNIYRLIYKEKECSRQQIAQQLALSLPTVTQGLNSLIDNGLIHISGTYKSSGGRKANIFRLVSNARYAVGIDITRNHLSFVLVNLNLDIISKKRMRLHFTNSAAYFSNLSLELEEFLDGAHLDRSKLLGVGISLPVIVQSDHMTISYATVIHIPQNIYQHINLPYPFLLFNDANSAGIAESWFYNAHDSVVYLLLSGSVGGAFIHSGQVFCGDNARASEFGHMCIIPNGRECYCGRKGCLDAYCSANILTDFTGGDLDRFFEDLKDNKGYQQVFDEYTDHLAIALNNLRMCYDCDIILGGTVGFHLKEHINMIRHKASKLNPFEENTSHIRRCHYTTEAAAVGAAIYFINKFVNHL